MNITPQREHESARMYEKRLAKENRTTRRRVAKYRKRQRIAAALADA